MYSYNTITLCTHFACTNIQYTPNETVLKLRNTFSKFYAKCIFSSQPKRSVSQCCFQSVAVCYGSPVYEFVYYVNGEIYVYVYVMYSYAI